ncbi:MAG TPA: DUF4149 domain-containing protein [Candidatus Avalokitesvara rifleensis]|uniref:DUF4149 domain-containing protein n=1 Tax=Candidatus Avalokitesvara rifleensis TaxID=3367620 RepID=UPI0027128272|nr:DUF4149 domain-containing protein [Candidatus Brocadiales bacterium]
MIPILKSIHVLALVLWIGGMAFMTFVAAPSVFKVLPREQAGDVVGDIFPKYFTLGYVYCLFAILTAIGVYLKEDYWNKPKLLVLGLMLILTFYDGMVVAPRAHAVRTEMKKAEQEEQKKALWGEFVRLHSQSAAINLIVLGLGIAVVITTAYFMRV